jgi:hypothetical protein
MGTATQVLSSKGNQWAVGFVAEEEGLKGEGSS